MKQTKKGNQWYFGMRCGRPHLMPNVALIHMWRPVDAFSEGRLLSAT
jgi:hypothetical protein